MHGPYNVDLGWLRHGVLLIVRKDDHVFPSVTKVTIEICRHVLHIVDASSQLASLAKVVDANQESLSPPGAGRVLKVVPLWCPVSKALHTAWRRWRGVVIAIYIGVGVDCWKS